MEFSEFDINTEFVLVVNFHLFLRNSGIYISFGKPGDELLEPDVISRLQHCFFKSPLLLSEHSVARPNHLSSRTGAMS